MSRTKILLIILALCPSTVLLFSSFAHPFYLSVTDLSYNSKDRTLQGSVRIFANDLEATLSKINGKSVDLLNAKDKKTIEKMLAKYLNEKLTIKIGEQSIPYSFLGYEKESESFWLYVEAKSCPFPSHISVTNTVLYEFSKEQSNIVQMDLDGKKQSGKLTFPDKTMVFEF